MRVNPSHFSNHRFACILPLSLFKPERASNTLPELFALEGSQNYRSCRNKWVLFCLYCFVFVLLLCMGS